ncbi:MAG: hypothetical protein IPJ85_00275 [Flavobacteriales bacterium]|nr:hypothetical protein [Flavobacteriales bacterium]
MHERDRHLFIPRESGSKLPLVCVHGDDANRLLPGLIHPERPFAAFKHQGDGGRRVALDRLDVIAARFLKELNEAGWKPPFALCGYSFGGIIAFEMAQQLARSGTSQVPLLILIDAYAPSIHVQAMQSDRRLITRVRDTVYGTATKTFMATNLRMPGRIHHHHIISTYDEAIRHYTPEPYAGKMLLIKSQAGWGRKTSDGTTWSQAGSSRT